MTPSSASQPVSFGVDGPSTLPGNFPLVTKAVCHSQIEEKISPMKNNHAGNQGSFSQKQTFISPGAFLGLGAEQTSQKETKMEARIMEKARLNLLNKTWQELKVQMDSYLTGPSINMGTIVLADEVSRLMREIHLLRSVMD